MKKCLAAAALLLVFLARLRAGNPAPTQTISTDGNAYGAPIPVNSPFPDNVYGADHGGSALALSSPFTSPFGNTDHSRGQFVYGVAPFVPRGSEGVFGMDVWLEQQDSAGNWSPATLNGGICDSGSIYQPVNTPNPGPSPGYTFAWTYDATPLPPNTNFRVFIYVYLYNQGGGSQGDFPVYSATATVNTGPANDPPRIAWTPSSGVVNPSQVTAGQNYAISADAQDDNGNLTSVNLLKNGQNFANAGGGNGYSGNGQSTSSDPAGTVTYTAWAGDADGAQSPVITWTVTISGMSSQAPVASSDTSLPFFSQPFTPDYEGGSGTGGWQFCVVDWTDWDGGGSGYTGTNLGPSPGNSPGAVWVPAWNPPAPGTYNFWVARDGDSNFNPSALAGPYILTITPTAPVGSFDEISSATAASGDVIDGSGWAADAQLGAPLSSVSILVDGGAGGTFSATLGSARPDVQAANTTWGLWSPKDLTSSGWSFSWPLPDLSPGTHTFTAVAADTVYNVSATIGSQSFTVTPPPASPTNPPSPTPPPPASNPIPPPTNPTPTPPGGGSPTPAPLVRIRYLGPPSFFWTDPTGLVNSPWPTFATPQPASPIQSNITLLSPPSPAP